MNKHSPKKELILLPVLLVAVLLCVVGHFLLQPSYQNNHVIEYMLAALPFALFGLVIIAFKIASKSEEND
ncbi:hypothetical protein [Pseudoalteromonas mariniglutinosa]|uniref:hypothetical protein n=1 Tax=Pseudoalteromonas mariniglutinosa TaxID=206042 RepID=UPI00384A5F44